MQSNSPTSDQQNQTSHHPHHHHIFIFHHNKVSIIEAILIGRGNLQKLPDVQTASPTCFITCTITERSCFGTVLVESNSFTVQIL